MPYPDEEEEEEELQNGQPERPDPSEQQRQAAKGAIEDFTRNIQRKKEKELASRPVVIPKLKPFVPTGDEVKQVVPGGSRAAAPGPSAAPPDKDKKGGT